METSFFTSCITPAAEQDPLPPNTLQHSPWRSRPTAFPKDGFGPLLMVLGFSWFCLGLFFGYEET